MKLFYNLILVYCIAIIYALVAKKYIDFIAVFALSVSLVGAFCNQP